MSETIYKNGVLVEVIYRNLENEKEQKIQCLRYSVETAIKNVGIDEKTQLNAIAGIYSPERCEAIKSYIAACRNEYLRCKALILAAQTNDESDAVQFVTPEVPAGL
jgi:hypothetical protein